jgi:glycosyltransferase involved in cell wall biosynthesis
MTQPKITFAITTHNEGKYVVDLLDQLVPFCEESGDEIVVLDDYSHDEITKKVLFQRADFGSITVELRKFNNDFSEHKNYLNSLCKGEYIFQVDADERLHEELLDNLHGLVEMNHDIELFYIPRVNIVEGLTPQDVQMYGWKLNDKNYINFPDYQTRLYKNLPHIMWRGKVHERIEGFKTFALIPPDERWSLIHIKKIERQREQNRLYDSL